MSKELVKDLVEKIGIKTFNEVMQFLYLCNQRGIDYGDLREYQGYLKGTSERSSFRRIRRKCPRCKSLLGIRGIQVKKGKANVHGYKSHWFCLNEKCLWEEYSKKDLVHSIREYGR